MPLFTLVTICLNAEGTIARTILSVRKQIFRDFEYIIIDGLSHDNTLTEIQKYEDYVDYLIVEEDRGISDAFNKGIRVASGDYILFVNADDELVSERTLLDLKSNIECNGFPEAIFHSWVSQIDRVGRSLINKPGPENGLRWGMVFNHPGMLVHREVYSKYGLYDISIKVCMDYEFLVRCYLGKIDFFEIPQVTVNYYAGGVSDKDFHIGYFEAFKIQNRQFGNNALNWLNYIKSLVPLYLARRSVFRSIISHIKDFVYKVNKSNS